MNIIEKRILDNFKSLLINRVKVHKLILFGSRARGDANPASDMDMIVIVDGPITDEERNYISDCAWEACYEQGIVLVPVVFTRPEWERGPERYSLLAQAVEREGVPW